MSNSEQKVWFVTGCSVGGLGHAIAERALKRNDLVVATARNLESMKDLQSDNCRLLQLDITEPIPDIEDKVSNAIAFWGRIDVLVNNAGHGILGFTEEVAYDGYLRQFHINFFGHLNVTNALLPQMRGRRQGTIVFIGSRSSYRSHVPMMGPYIASKAALTAMADTLAAELAPYEIRVLNVLPGAIRTQTWNSARMVHVSSGAPFIPTTAAFPDLQHKEPISDYDPLRTHCIEALSNLKQKGDASGDPVKAADAIIDVVRGEGLGKKAKEKDGWPPILALGEDGDRDVRQKCELVLHSLDEWRDVALSISS